MTMQNSSLMRWTSRMMIVLMTCLMMPLSADGNIAGLAVCLFLVLRVTDILGYTKVFPFTRSVR